MIERRIKELSIALEALSRINSYRALQHTREVNELLEKTFREAKENQVTFTPMPPLPEHLKSKSIDTDDIPF